VLKDALAMSTGSKIAEETDFQSKICSINLKMKLDIMLV